MLGVQAGALGALFAFGAAAFILFAVRQADATDLAVARSSPCRWPTA